MSSLRIRERWVLQGALVSLKAISDRGSADEPTMCLSATEHFLLAQNPLARSHVRSMSVPGWLALGSRVVQESHPVLDALRVLATEAIRRPVRKVDWLNLSQDLRELR